MYSAVSKETRSHLSMQPSLAVIKVDASFSMRLLNALRSPHYAAKLSSELVTSSGSVSSKSAYVDPQVNTSRLTLWVVAVAECLSDLAFDAISMQAIHIHCQSKVWTDCLMHLKKKIIIIFSYL